MRIKVAAVVAEDTNVLVMLVYFRNSEMADVFFRTETRKHQPVKFKNVSTIVEPLHPTII